MADEQGISAGSATINVGANVDAARSQIQSLANINISPLSSQIAALTAEVQGLKSAMGGLSSGASSLASGPINASPVSVVRRASKIAAQNTADLSFLNQPFGNLGASYKQIMLKSSESTKRQIAAQLSKKYSASEQAILDAVGIQQQAVQEAVISAAVNSTEEVKSHIASTAKFGSSIFTSEQYQRLHAAATARADYASKQKMLESTRTHKDMQSELRQARTSGFIQRQEDSFTKAQEQGRIRMSLSDAQATSVSESEALRREQVIAEQQAVKDRVFGQHRIRMALSDAQAQSQAQLIEEQRSTPEYRQRMAAQYQAYRSAYPNAPISEEERAANAALERDRAALTSGSGRGGFRGPHKGVSHLFWRTFSAIFISRLIGEMGIGIMQSEAVKGIDLSPLSNVGNKTLSQALHNKAFLQAHSGIFSEFFAGRTMSDARMKATLPLLMQQVKSENFFRQMSGQFGLEGISNPTLKAQMSEQLKYQQQLTKINQTPMSSWMRSSLLGQASSANQRMMSQINYPTQQIELARMQTQAAQMLSDGMPIEAKLIQAQEKMVSALDKSADALHPFIRATYAAQVSMINRQAAFAFNNNMAGMRGQLTAYNFGLSGHPNAMRLQQINNSLDMQRMKILHQYSNAHSAQELSVITGAESSKLAAWNKRSPALLSERHHLMDWINASQTPGLAGSLKTKTPLLNLDTEQMHIARLRSLNNQRMSIKNKMSTTKAFEESIWNFASILGGAEIRGGQISAKGHQGTIVGSIASIASIGAIARESGQTNQQQLAAALGKNKIAIQNENDLFKSQPTLLKEHQNQLNQVNKSIKDLGGSKASILGSYNTQIQSLELEMKHNKDARGLALSLLKAKGLSEHQQYLIKTQQAQNSASAGLAISRMQTPAPTSSQRLSMINAHYALLEKNLGLEKGIPKGIISAKMATYKQANANAVAANAYHTQLSHLSMREKLAMGSIEANQSLSHRQRAEAELKEAAKIQKQSADITYKAAMAFKGTPAQMKKNELQATTKELQQMALSDLHLKAGMRKLQGPPLSMSGLQGWGLIGPPHGAWETKHKHEKHTESMAKDIARIANFLTTNNPVAIFGN